MWTLNLATICIALIPVMAGGGNGDESDDSGEWEDVDDANDGDEDEVDLGDIVVDDPRFEVTKVACLICTTHTQAILLVGFQCDECGEFCALKLVGMVYTRPECANVAIAFLGANISEGEVASVAAHRDQIIGFIADAVHDGQNIDAEVRLDFIDVLATLAESHPGVVRGSPATRDQAIPALIAAVGEADFDPAWCAAKTAFEPDELDMPDRAGQVLDRLSVALESNYMVATAGPLIMAGLDSDELADKVGALATITSIAEGSAVALAHHLDSVVAAMVPLLADPHPRVRWGACGAFGQIVQDFEDVKEEGSNVHMFQSRYHASVVPALLAITSDAANPRVQAFGLSALGNFVENMDESILAPYLNGVLLQLGSLLASEHRIVLESTITCIAATASSNEGIFQDAYRKMPLLLGGLPHSVRPLICVAKHSILHASTHSGA